MWLDKLKWDANGRTCGALGRRAGARGHASLRHLLYFSCTGAMWLRSRHLPYLEWPAAATRRTLDVHEPMTAAGTPVGISLGRACPYPGYPSGSGGASIQNAKKAKLQQGRCVFVFHFSCLSITF